MLAWVTTAPTPGATWMQREPTAISLVAMAIPNMPVRSHRPMSENVVNSMPINAASVIPPILLKPRVDEIE